MERAGLGLESPSYVQKRLVLGKQQRMMAEHCQANKLVRQPKREKAYGVGRQPRALRGKSWIIGERGISKKRFATEDADIDLGYIKSKEYQRKFEKLTDSSQVNEAIYKAAKASLEHRKNTTLEDLYLVSVLDGKIKASVTGDKSYLAVTATKSVNDAVKNNPRESLFAVHNHPSNIPPTGSDLSASGYRGYAGAVVVLHNGEVYYYKHGNKPFSSADFDRVVARRREKEYYEKEYYDEVKTFEEALAEFSRRFGIKWEKL